VRLSNPDFTIRAVDREWLTRVELSEGWRLACRAEVEEDLECWAPKPLRMPVSAIAGRGRAVKVEPAVKKLPIELEIERAGPRDVLEAQLRKALADAGLGSAVITPQVVQQARDLLAEFGGSITLTICGEHLLCVEAGDTSGRCFGLAIDLGTTTVVGSLVDLATGEVLAERSHLNRQAVFGADVISRVAYTSGSETRRREIQNAVLETLNQLVIELSDMAGVAEGQVYQAMVVGNPTMLHLLLGVDAQPIARAPFVTTFDEEQDVAAADLGLAIHPQARVQTLPFIGAYAGADTVGGLHATDLLRSEQRRLFVDVGTNSEIALGSSEGVWACSAPAGPAFEGGRIRDGMMASAGAIYRVALGDPVELDVVYGDVPRGICGSGLIQAIAELGRVGLLEPSGRLRRPEEVPDHPLVSRLVEIDGMRAFRLTHDVVLTQVDIREVQAAKGAISTGIAVLLESAGTRIEDLDEVILAGSFGSAIDPASARSLGLVPGVELEKIQSVGNTALEGAKMALLSFRERQMMHGIPSRVRYVELSAMPDFNDRYLTELSFPLEEGP
jgi:uncharacterized 2Fe-2S/4Fe-4S cluster protein (DUF4445 family)